MVVRKFRMLEIVERIFVKERVKLNFLMDLGRLKFLFFRKGLGGLYIFIIFKSGNRLEK